MRDSATRQSCQKARWSATFFGVIATLILSSIALATSTTGATALAPQHPLTTDPLAPQSLSFNGGISLFGASTAVTITSVTPNHGPLTGGTAITITGSDFPNIQWTQTASGGEHTCGILDGKVYCWGKNEDGQLGNGTTTPSSVPVPVDTTTGDAFLAGKTVTAVAAGYAHTCAVAEGQAFCWGRNVVGQLGNNSITPSSIPVAVDLSTAPALLANKTVTSLAAGYYHTCAIADGAAYCWGDNDIGQLGNNSTTPSPIPVAVDLSTAPALLAGKTVTSLSIGYNFTCAIADGQVYCWGSGLDGQLGNGDTGFFGTPVAVSTQGVLADRTVTAITTGHSHACAIADGAAYCWGTNFNNQLGNNSTTDSATPIPVDTTTAPALLAGKTVTGISANSSSTCAIADGRVYCWGYGDNGQIGNNIRGYAPIPTAVNTLSTSALFRKTVTSISSGFNHSCAITADNQVACWGSGTSGQLGNGSTAQRSLIPVLIDFSTPSPISDLSIGGISATDVVSIGTTTITARTPLHFVSGPTDIEISFTTGDTATLEHAYLYDYPPAIAGVTPDHGPLTGDTAVAITGVNFPDIEWDQVVSGTSHTCATQDGKAYCWGANTSGQLGTGDTTDSSTPVPVDVSAGSSLRGKDVTALAAGDTHTCALTDEGRVSCWGLGTSGQLGVGNTSGSLIPIAVDTSYSSAIGSRFVTSIAAGDAHVCAIADEVVYCWGSNSSGQLGNKTMTNQIYPVAVTAASGDALYGKVVTAVVAGDTHTCVIADTRAYCWGANTSGQLGDNSTYARTFPVAVNTTTAPALLAGKTITSLSAGDTHTCAIADGQAYCWGSNDSYGQLGNNSTSRFLIPVAVNNAYDSPLYGKTVTSLSAGDTFTCALTSDGQVACWGQGTYGQLGTGFPYNSSSPVAINTSGTLAGKSISSVSSGGSHSCALTSDGKISCWGGNQNGQLGNNVQSSYDTPNPSPLATSISLTFGGVETTDITYVDSTTITAVTPAGLSLGAVDVTVAFMNGTSATLENGYTYTRPAPIITKATPDSGPTIGGYPVTLSGTDFPDVQWDQVSAGLSHTCGLLDGKVYCWGKNDSGQLGTGDTETGTAPTPVITSGALADKTIESITSGGDHTCALDSNGTVYCWGKNDSGQLGTGDTENSQIPVAVDTSDALADKTIAKITAGKSHTCAITLAGDAYCWGKNDLGQLGNGNAAVTSSPTPLAVDTASILPDKPLASISAGYSHTCAITTDGIATCWGKNDLGQLGNNSISPSAAPVLVDATSALADKTVTDISAGESHTCAVADGGAFCWGANYSYGQLGNNSTARSTVPVSVDLSGSSSLANKTVTAINTGNNFTCALASDGSISCWGHGAYGQLGNSMFSSSIPSAVNTTTSLSGKTISSISTGAYHACVLTDAGQISCWGRNDSSQIVHDEESPNVDLPLAIDFAIESVSFGDIYAPYAYYNGPSSITVIAPPHYDVTAPVDITVNFRTGATATLRNGFSYYHMPLITKITPSEGPTAGGTAVTIKGQDFPKVGWSKVVSGEDHTCGIIAGKVYCWGNGAGGRLGNGSTDNSNIPVAVDFGRMTVTDIAAGINHTCAVADGKAYCWGGGGQNGQLGNGTTDHSSIPVAVDAFGPLSGKTVTKITAGNDFACAIANGQVYCWGHNGYGILGNTSDSHSTVPVGIDITGVLSGKTVTAISAGSSHVCAIASGRAYCWGKGYDGQLGHGSIDDSVIPTPLDTTLAPDLASSTFTAISSGPDFSCAVASGRAYCWGTNTYGQLGNGTTDHSTTPVAVDTTSGNALLAGKTVTSISAGNARACAIADERAYCWGVGDYGILGNGLSTSSSIPVAVLTPEGKTVSSIDIGVLHSCLIADSETYCWGMNYAGQLGDGTNDDTTVPTSISPVDVDLTPVITFGGNPATDVIYVDGSTITARTPAYPTEEPVYVFITFADGRITFLEDGYTYTNTPRTITSSTYDINRDTAGSEYVIGIYPSTTLEDFLANFDNPAEQLEVLDSTGLVAITDPADLIGTGMTINLTVGGTTYDSLSIAVRGDTSGDGMLTIADNIRITNHLSGSLPLIGSYRLAADTNKDGMITIADFVKITNFLAGLLRPEDLN